MAAVFRAGATVSSSASAASVTMTLDASTVSGDTAIVFLTRTAGITVTVSGLGATWAKVAQDASFADGPAELWVGTGCSATQTVVTVTFSPNSGCDALALVFGGVPVAVSNAITVVTSANPAAPTQTVTSSAGDQAVANFFLIVANPVPTGFTDTPAAFTTKTNAAGTTWNTIRKVSAYRLPVETGAEARTVNDSISEQAACASVLLGQSVPASPYRHPTILVRSRAVPRAAVI